MAPILADSPRSPSWQALRAWLQQWEHAGRPTASAFTPVLVHYDGDDLPGWDLRMFLSPGSQQMRHRFPA